jgi:cold shock CspA family protein
MRQRGIIDFYNPSKSIGFISVRTPGAAKGVSITRYFFHTSRITSFEIDYTIEVGDFVEFDISTRDPKPGNERAAVNIHVFAKEPTPVVTAGVADALAGNEVSS